MRILVTNDDGTASPGLWALAAALAEVGEVVVVAPFRDMSGSSTATMLARPARLRQIRPSRRLAGVAAYSVTAPPASCVLLALRGAISGGRVDFVASGVNSGANLGRDALLSGTVGAAFIAAMEGVPALAVSIAKNAERTWDWTSASAVAARLARRLHDEPLREGLLLNLNLPSVPGPEMAGVRLTHLSRECCLTRLSVQPHESRPATFRFLTERLVPRGEDTGSDEWAIANDFVSLTPLSPDVGCVTDDGLLAGWLSDLLPRR